MFWLTILWVVTTLLHMMWTHHCSHVWKEMMCDCTASFIMLISLCSFLWLFYFYSMHPAEETDTLCCGDFLVLPSLVNLIPYISVFLPFSPDCCYAHYMLMTASLPKPAHILNQPSLRIFPNPLSDPCSWSMPRERWPVKSQILWPKQR